MLPIAGRGQGGGWEPAAGRVGPELCGLPRMPPPCLQPGLPSCGPRPAMTEPPSAPHASALPHGDAACSGCWHRYSLVFFDLLLFQR